MRSGVFPVVFSLTVVASAFAAERPHIVGPVIGYQCMALNLTVETDARPEFACSGLRGTVCLGPGCRICVAANGSSQSASRGQRFCGALSPTGNVIWIKGNVVQPYHSLADPTARCVPVKFSNGRYGFDYPHS